MIKRLVCALLMLTVLLSACSCDQVHFHGGNNRGNTNNNTNQQNINQAPNNDSEDTGDKTEETEKPIYVYSILAKTIHLKDGCASAIRIREKGDYYKEHDGDIIELIQKEFEICSICFPSEEPEEKEDIPEEDPVDPNEATFIVNKKSLTVHIFKCGALKNTKEENKKYTDKTLKELIEEGCLPCGSCMPEEYRLYVKDKENAE